MAELLTTPIIETNTINSVQIIKYSIDYKNSVMTWEYVTLLANGASHEHGYLRITDATEIAQVYSDTEALIIAGDSLDLASSKVAYAKVLSKVLSKLA